MTTYHAVAQTQSSCLIAARERPRAGSKQMATYQAVVAQTQSSSSCSSNSCRSVATQTWSTHVVRSLLHTVHYPLCIINELLCGAHIHSVDSKLNCYLVLFYIFSRTRSSSMLAALPSLPLFFPPLFFPLKINWRN